MGKSFGRSAGVFSHQVVADKVTVVDICCLRRRVAPITRPDTVRVEPKASYILHPVTLHAHAKRNKTTTTTTTTTTTAAACRFVEFRYDRSIWVEI